MQNEVNLEEIFKCFICFGKVNKAVMCPHCSKLCCSECINVRLGNFWFLNAGYRNGYQNKDKRVHIADANFQKIS